MKIRNYFECNDYKNTTYQNVWDARKDMLTEKLHSLNYVY